MSGAQGESVQPDPVGREFQTIGQGIRLTFAVHTPARKHRLHVDGPAHFKIAVSGPGRQADDGDLPVSQREPGQQPLHRHTGQTAAGNVHGKVGIRIEPGAFDCQTGGQPTGQLRLDAEKPAEVVKGQVGIEDNVEFRCVERSCHTAVQGCGACRSGNIGGRDIQSAGLKGRFQMASVQDHRSFRQCQYDFTDIKFHPAGRFRQIGRGPEMDTPNLGVPVFRLGLIPDRSVDQGQGIQDKIGAYGGVFPRPGPGGWRAILWSHCRSEVDVTGGVLHQPGPWPF